MLYVPTSFASGYFFKNIWEQEEYVLALLLLLVIVVCMCVRVRRKNENKVVFIVERIACKCWNYNAVLRKKNKRVLNSTHKQTRLSFFNMSTTCRQSMIA